MDRTIAFEAKSRSSSLLQSTIIPFSSKVEHLADKYFNNIALFWYNKYMNKEKLQTYINKNISQNKIAKIENVSLSTVRYWFKVYNLKSNFSSLRETKRSWSDEQLIAAVKSSYFMSDVISKIGLSVRPGNYTTVNKHIKRLNIDTSHFGQKKKHRGGPRKLTHELLFTENSDVSRSNVKLRIIKEKLIKYSCAICKITEWKGEKLSLVLDHINGVNNDNRLHNLRFLCPNCNSLQKTFCRKS